jgi:hypothetical protein
VRILTLPDRHDCVFCVLLYNMKALPLSFGILLLQTLLSQLIFAEEQQVQLVGEIDIEEAVLEGVIPEIVPDKLYEEPILEPIWSLCGDPSTHLLVAYSLDPFDRV